MSVTAALDVYPLRPELPTELQVEVTSACNLRCAMCLVRYRPPVNKVEGAFPVERFRGLLDELPGLEKVTLQGLGEPLLHPHLIDMISYAHGRGIRVGFNSNATLLSARRAEELVAAGLDWLHVSIDGATAETFDAIRDGASLPVVLANLRGLVDARHRAGSATPWIRAVFVAMRRNVGELADLVWLLSRIGVNELRVQNLSHDFADTDPSGSYREIREYAHEQALWTEDNAVQEAFAAARQAADAAGVLLRLPAVAEATGSETPAQPGCTWPWDSAYVTSAGVVQPCCMVMGDDRVSLGRLTEQSFTEIWHGTEYVRFRRGLRHGPAPTVCRGCALYRGTF